MVTRKGYKLTEVGEIPEDWGVQPVENLCSITTGGRNTQDSIADGAYPFFVRSQTVERINSYSFDGEAVLTAGDGVGTGKIFHYINGKCDVHQRVYLMSRFSGNLLGYYFFLYFSANFYDRIMQMTAKSSVDSVRREMIARMPIPVPSIEEQTAIATALSDADALIEALEQSIAKKRHIKQGAMQELLTGKKRLPGFGEKNQKYKLTEVGEIPEDWEVKPLGELFNFFGGFTASRAQLSFEGYPYLHYGDIHATSKTCIDVCLNDAIPKLNIDLKKVTSTSLLQDGDVVFVDASEDDEGTSRHIVVKNAINKPFIAGLHTITARTKDARIVSAFKEFCFQTATIRTQFIFFAVGTKVKGVNKKTITQINLVSPRDIVEQTAIAAVLSDMDEEIAALEVKLTKAKQIKAGMMQELLTGRIRLI